MDGLEIKSCEANFSHVTAQAALYAFHENTYSTYVVTSAEELSTMS